MYDSNLFLQVVLEEQVANRSTVMTKYANANSHLYCPHDFSPGIEFRDDLPTLLGDATDNCKAEIEDSLKLFTAKPALSVFEKASLEVGIFLFRNKWNRINQFPNSF